MTQELPRSIIGSRRSGFALIDPQTELFHHKLGRAQHVAISYVWGDWTDSPEDGHHLRHWPELRRRLLTIVGPGASTFMKICSGNATRCWVDCKCIDQNSPTDKSYWVPRMDEIYSEARCTVLLVKNVPISYLQEVERLIGCDVDEDNHSCLLTQSCASLYLPDTELKQNCVRALRLVYDGQWRKRAWIFQEILLSQEYILSDGDGAEIKLSDIGTIASLFFRDNLGEEWLQELANWCRRIVRLRSYYFNYTLCPSNILQMAVPLEATLPCDKYYALCGVLRLKKVEYQVTHTQTQALQAVLIALTQEGRFTWLSAIPPSPSYLSNRVLLDKSLLNFIENRLDMSSAVYGQPEVSASSVSFSCFRVGKIKQVSALSEVIGKALEHIRIDDMVGDIIPPRLAVLPALLFRVCRDTIQPLVEEPILSRLCRVFHLSAKQAESTILMKLLGLQNTGAIEDCEAAEADVELTWAGARSIQKHIALIQDSLDFITWSPIHDPGKEYYALGSKGCSNQTSVLVVRNYPLLLALDHHALNDYNSSETFCWRTVLHQPTNKEISFRTGLIGVLTHRRFWKKCRLSLQLQETENM